MLQEFAEIFGYILPFRVIEWATRVPLRVNDELEPLILILSALKLTMPVSLSFTFDPLRSKVRGASDRGWLITTPLPAAQPAGVGAESVRLPESDRSCDPGI